MGRRKRGWNAASRLSLTDLRQLIEAKQAETVKMSERREALVAELGEVEARIAADGGNGSRHARKRGPGRPRKVKRGPGRPPKAKRGRPPKSAATVSGKRRSSKAGPKGQSELHGLIRSALKGAKEPLKATDIAKHVVGAGYKTMSKVFHLIVGQRLAEMKDVRKPRRGLYALV